MPEENTQNNTEQNDSSNSPSQEQDNNQNNNQEEEEDSSKEDEVVFHPHKGKIMQIKPYTIISSMSYSSAYGTPTGDGDVEMKFDDDDFKYIYSGVSCKLKLRRDTDRQFSDTGIEEVYGEDDIKIREHYPTIEQLVEYDTLIGEKEFISDEFKDYDVASTMVCRSASDDGLYGFVTEVTHKCNGSNIKVKDWGLALEDTTKELEFKGLYRSHVIEEVAKSYGLTPIVDLTGLDDEIVDWNNKKTVSKGGGSSQSSDENVNGDGSMTEDQLWDIYKTFVYGGWGSGHDPKKAWEKMGTTKGASADCYDATAWAYYCYNFKVGIPARDICYHSDSAPSGSHHTIQIKKNGNWIDPPQLGEITSGLGGGPKGKDFHVCREPPNGDSIPEYKRCPYSNND